MSIKKSLLLGAMALTTIAFAIPATASATTGTVWTHEGDVLETTSPTEGLEGKVGFQTALGGIECAVEMTIVLKGAPGGGHTGTVHDFDIDTDTCTGSGLLTECTLEDDENTNLPWLLHNTATGPIHITNVSVWELLTTRDDPHEVDGECPIEEAHLTFPTITAEPDNKAAISFVDLSGVGICHVFGLETECEREGRLFATEPETYGSLAV